MRRSRVGKTAEIRVILLREFLPYLIWQQIFVEKVNFFSLYPLQFTLTKNIGLKKIFTTCGCVVLILCEIPITDFP